MIHPVPLEEEEEEEEEEEKSSCIICLENKGKLIEYNHCGLYYVHQECISNWNANDCIICRKKIVDLYTDGSGSGNGNSNDSASNSTNENIENIELYNYNHEYRNECNNIICKTIIIVNCFLFGNLTLNYIYNSLLN
jgi:hypothetical protein